MASLRLRLPALGLLAAFLAVSCATSGKTRSSDDAVKVLLAVVTEREYNAPGSAGGGSFRGSGNYYLSFEAQDGDRTVRYRFPVTYQQYFRYPEGTRVRIVVANDLLRDIRPARDE